MQAKCVKPSQLNRLFRDAHDTVVTVILSLAEQLGSSRATYELLYGMGLAVHNNHRRGPGWLDSIAVVGW